MFAGLLTKVGVYAILRIQTLLFPDSPLTDLLLWAALVTMVVGILGAIAQSDIKRMLSFTLVSHIGYMIFGIGLATDAGISGAVFYVAHHITIQTALFLVVGLIERRGGQHRSAPARRARPGWRRCWRVLFFVPAMNLAGIPPMSGFLGKVGLLQAGLDVGSPLAYVLVAGGVVTSLLTLYAVAQDLVDSRSGVPRSRPTRWPRRALPGEEADGDTRRGRWSGTGRMCTSVSRRTLPVILEEAR